MSRLSEIESQRKLQGKSWNDLAEGLPVSGEALRIAFKRGKVQKEYLNHIEDILNQQNKQTIKEPEVDYESVYRFEDVVAKKVFDLLRDRLDRMEDKVNDSLALLEAISGIIKHSSHKTMEIDRKLKEVHKDTSESKKILEGR